MARKNQKGYALPNLAAMVAQGCALELSAIPFDGSLRLFFREPGQPCWQAVLTQRKDGPISYKISSLAALVEAVCAELPGVPLRLRHAGRNFYAGCSADPALERLQQHYQQAASNLQAAVLALLNISPTVDDKPWHILVALTYGQPPVAEATCALVAQMLNLPADWRTAASTTTQ